MGPIFLCVLNFLLQRLGEMENVDGTSYFLG